MKKAKAKAVRTTISITPSIYQKAVEVMRVRDFADFSGMLHQLIREEYERRIDREAWIVNAIATAIGKSVEEVRELIDARIPQAEHELLLEQKQHSQARKAKSVSPSVE